MSRFSISMGWPYHFHIIFDSLFNFPSQFKCCDTPDHVNTAKNAFLHRVTLLYTGVSWQLENLSCDVNSPADARLMVFQLAPNPLA
jgi:hypothetical protein